MDNEPLALLQIAVSALQDVRSKAEHQTSPAVETHLAAAFDNLLSARELLEQRHLDTSQYHPDVAVYLAEEEQRLAAAQEQQ